CAKDDGDWVWAAQPDQERDRASLHHIKAEELLVEAARKCEIAALERAMREKPQLERRRFWTLRCARLSSCCHARLLPSRSHRIRCRAEARTSSGRSSGPGQPPGTPCAS